MSLDLREIYPMIDDISQHAIGIQNLLKGPMEGLANLSLKFIVAYFKSLDFKLSEIKEITSVWQSLDTFHYAWNDQSLVESETERFFNAHYKIDKGDVPTLEDVYGQLFDEDGNYYSIKDQIVFDNDVFCNLKSIKVGAFYLFCVMKSEQHRTKKEMYTAKELKDIALKDIDTIRVNAKQLVALGLVEEIPFKPKGKKGGRPTIYFRLTDKDIKEFTKIDAGKLDGLILRASHPIKSKRISERAFMVAVYIRFRSFGNKKSCYMKQGNMAAELGISRQHLNSAIAELEKHKLIRKQEHEIFSTLEYVIMY